MIRLSSSVILLRQNTQTYVFDPCKADHIKPYGPLTCILLNIIIAVFTYSAMCVFDTYYLHQSPRTPLRYFIDCWGGGGDEVHIVYPKIPNFWHIPKKFPHKQQIAHKRLVCYCWFGLMKGLVWYQNKYLCFFATQKILVSSKTMDPKNPFWPKFQTPKNPLDPPPPPSPVNKIYEWGLWASVITLESLVRAIAVTVVTLVLTDDSFKTLTMLGPIALWAVSSSGTDMTPVLPQGCCTVQLASILILLTITVTILVTTLSNFYFGLYQFYFLF